MSTLARVRDVTALICGLPEAPTRGWCEQAAASLRSAAEGSTVVLLLGRIDDQGRIVAEGHFGIAPPPARAGDQGLAALRTAVGRLQTLGPAPQGHERWAAAGLVERHPGGWPPGPLDRLWTGMIVGELITIMCAADQGGGRVLVGYLAVDGDPEEATEVLVATLPLLAAKARAALAPLEAEPRAWISGREQPVLDLLLDGRTVEEMAAALGRSEHTVQDHIKSLRWKLRSRTRSELVARALGRGGSARSPLPSEAELIDHARPPRRSAAGVRTAS